MFSSGTYVTKLISPRSTLAPFFSQIEVRLLLLRMTLPELELAVTLHTTSLLYLVSNLYGDRRCRLEFPPDLACLLMWVPVFRFLVRNVPDPLRFLTSPPPFKEHENPLKSLTLLLLRFFLR